MQSSAYDKGSVSLTSSSILPVILGSPALSISALSPPYNKGGDSTNKIEAGLPNITGKTYGDSYAIDRTDGAFIFTNEHFNHLSASDKSNGGYVHLDASRSNLIYGNSDTVQPAVIVLIPQIKI